MKVQILRKSNKKIRIPTSLFLKSYDEVRTNPFFKTRDIAVGTIIDLPEENINLALQRNPDLYYVVIDTNANVEQQEENISARDELLEEDIKPVSQKKKK